MDRIPNNSSSLAAAITKAASKQTYYTIRLFADRERAADAYRAYGYFRWVDDVIDAETGSGSVPSEAETFEKITFVNRQKSILEACYRGETPENLCSEEWMLVDLVRNDTEKNSGLGAYLRNMMAVMEFDAKRRGQIISRSQLATYSRSLAIAVTEALYYFIGHDEPSPRHPARYLAVTAAHITHMLRDGIEDAEAGYFNIPREYLQARDIQPQDVSCRAYREWVRERVKMARVYFKAGRECTARVKNLRCRLAGFAYTTRFEWILRTIERDHYQLRPEYPERKSLRASLWMAWLTLFSMLASPWLRNKPQPLALRNLRTKEL